LLVARTAQKKLKMSAWGIPSRQPCNLDSAAYKAYCMSRPYSSAAAAKHHVENTQPADRALVYVRAGMGVNGECKVVRCSGFCCNFYFVVRMVTEGAYFKWHMREMEADHGVHCSAVPAWGAKALAADPNLQELVYARPTTNEEIKRYLASEYNVIVNHDSFVSEILREIENIIVTQRSANLSKLPVLLEFLTTENKGFVVRQSRIMHWTKRSEVRNDRGGEWIANGCANKRRVEGEYTTSQLINPLLRATVGPTGRWDVERTSANPGPQHIRGQHGSARGQPPAGVRVPRGGKRQGHPRAARSYQPRRQPWRAWSSCFSGRKPPTRAVRLYCSSTAHTSLKPRGTGA